MPGSPWLLGPRLVVAVLALGGTVVGAVGAETPAAAPVNATPSPLDLPLAEVYVPGAIDLWDYWVSEKRDGVRAYWDGERLLSRGGYPIRAPDRFTAAFPPVPLDGELWLGRGRFAEMSGLARRQTASPGAWRDGGGRSDDLLNVNPYLDAEARVIGHLPGHGKYQGMLGALLVEQSDGTRFRLGTGFTDAERAEPPAIGSLVAFKYHGRSKNGPPRFASFLRIRAEQ